MAPSERSGPSFRTKLTLVMAAASAGPVIAMGFALIDVNARAIERESRALQIALADDLARTIEEDADATRAALELVARVLSDASADEALRASVPASLVTRERALDHVGVFDADGRVIDVAREAGSEAAALPDRLSGSIRAAAVRDGVSRSAVEVAAGAPRSLVVVPIRAGDRVTGFVASRASLAAIEDRVERLVEAHLRPQGGTLYVVDEQMRVVAEPDLERSRALPSARGRPLLRGVDPRALRGRAGRAAETVGEGGEPVVGTVVGLERLPWVVAVEVPRARAYASLDEMRRIVLFSVALAVVVALLAAMALARLVTAPISRLTELAGHLAARRFDRRVDVRSRDELGVLASAMTRAASELAASDEQIRREAAIRADLGRFLPAELVDKVVRREHHMELGGARRAITVLFADVVAFTPLTEKLPAEEVVSLLNELFTVMTEIVFRHGGTVDKFVGDCVMAIFGAPEPLPDHARQAVACAEDMLHFLETANAGWQTRFGVSVQLAIGVHTGEAIVGNVGSEKRMDYTAIGDVVNVAARLETIARPQQILVSRATRDEAGDGFDYVSLGERILSGRSEPVELFEVRA